MGQFYGKSPIEFGYLFGGKIKATINDIAAYISTLPNGSPPATVDDDFRPHRWDSNFAIIEPGDSVAGKRNYALCVGCHGLEAEGMRLLNGPRLSGRYNWYLVRQLKYLKYGVRGTHQRDNIGRIMASAVGVLANDQAIYDVVAYIQTLPNGRD